MTNSNHSKILLVDDDVDYLELTRMRLEDAGFEVKCVSDGKQALEAVETSRQLDLIIMDVDMPERDGLTALINLRAKQASQSSTSKTKIPVLIATGLESERVEKLAWQHQADDFLRKPYGSEELIEKVSKLIGRK